MLTRKQIEKIALKNRVTLFTQERDYIQAAYLSLLYSKTMSFVFKGGTLFEDGLRLPEVFRGSGF